MIPSHIVLLDTFPLTPNGKVNLKALPNPDIAPTTNTAPRTLIETLLVDLYATLLNHPHIGIDDSFFDLGGNSLQAMQLITRLHTDLAADADVSAIFLAPTPRQLAAFLREKNGLEDADLGEEGLDGLDPLSGEKSATPLATEAGAVVPAPIPRRLADGIEPARGAQPSVGNGPLVELTNGNGGQWLFVVHAIGGTVYAYAHLARELAETYKVCGVEAAGLTQSSTAATALDVMVSGYVDAIRAVQPTGPYRLAGWSMGGLVAFEIARKLEGLGETVALLALLDTPFCLPPDPPPSESRLAALFVADVSRTLGWPSEDAATLGPSPDDDHLGWLAVRLDAGAGNIGAVRAEIERRFTVFKANTQMIAGYRPKTTVRAPALIAGTENSWDSAPRWETAIDGPVDMLRIPGEHYTLLQPPSVQRIAEAILELDRRR
jgi:thioesterase domain-containing protein/acyl carrier protein